MSGFYKIRSDREKGERYHKLAIAYLFPLFLILFLSFPVDAQVEFNKTKIRHIAIVTGYTEGITFGRPKDVFVDSGGEIYVVDYYNEAVYIFDRYFQPVSKIDKSNGLSTRPLSVAVNERGEIFVVEQSAQKGETGRILHFNLRGELQKEIGLKGFEGAETFSAIDMTVDREGNLYLAGGHAGLVILDRLFIYKMRIQPEETEKNQSTKSYINIVALGKDGRIYLVSEELSHVYVYDRTGNLLLKFGTKGGNVGKLSRPQGMAVDRQTGIAYIMDYMRHALSVYDEKGGFLFEYGGLGVDEGWFQYPKGIFCDENGRLYVADAFNKRIQIFDARQ